MRGRGKPQGLASCPALNDVGPMREQRSKAKATTHPRTSPFFSLFSSSLATSRALTHTHTHTTLHFFSVSLFVLLTTMIAKRFLSVGLVAVCLALAAQPAQANWIDDAQAGGQRVFQAAFDTWTECVPAARIHGGACLADADLRPLPLYPTGRISAATSWSAVSSRPRRPASSSS